jgi:hypothetical protein
MNFTFQFFKEESDHRVEAFLLPLTLDFPTVQKAREVIERIAKNNIAKNGKGLAHSVTLKSEDGKTSERWFQINGAWRRKEDT